MSETPTSASETATPKRYPLAVLFMLGNEFCERFSFYGMRGILTMYLTGEHHFSESTAATIFHAFIVLAYITPLLGSVAADTRFGAFKVILYVSLTYVMGHALLSVGALPSLSTGLRLFFDFSGLFVIAASTGGIKPCVAPFAANQFDESQAAQRSRFFSYFYMAINFGALIALIVTPIIRRTSCMGHDHCYPLAFGIPGILMLVAFLFFVGGWRFYKIQPASKNNLLCRAANCVRLGVQGKVKALMGKEEKKEHWLDYGIERYGKRTVTDVKALTSVCFLLVPMVVFWALFDQQGSTWVLQAKSMNGRMGSFTFAADQMNFLNCFFVLTLAPVLTLVVYPLVGKCVKTTALRRMSVGGLIAASSFIVAGFVELAILSTQVAPIESGNSLVFSLRVNYSLIPETGETIVLSEGPQLIPSGVYGLHDRLIFNSTKAYVLVPNSDGTVSPFEFPYENGEGDNTRLFLAVDKSSGAKGAPIYVKNANGDVVHNAKAENGVPVDIPPPLYGSDEYTIAFGPPLACKDAWAHGCTNVQFVASVGASNVLYIGKHAAVDHKLETLVPGNSVSLAWQIPQYFLITVGELLISITGLEFAYSQAPESMKNVLQAIWHTTVALGNMLDMLISATNVIENPAYAFFFYGTLMAAVILIFILSATRYTYYEDRKRQSGSEDTDEKEATARPSNATSKTSN
ncbi:unnamed protein product [Bursaphelenchus xylophilus]|uniref:(pine wood nematode) hypothetical protein n=1 Tax=Bursaphelenchus xylophilus TaxID=6326 RepID=A0A1I7S8P2_BURXY|nr:unnamed protein product [Bursaphelenchus xylophilus]CAG9089403.1 unnamed protein product [Bursaphelenchus xylophilus]